MRRDVACAVVGKWRIVEADLWDRDHLDLVETGAHHVPRRRSWRDCLRRAERRSRFAYSPSIIFFTWEGFDEMDEVRGDGSAELEHDGALEIEFRYHLGDEAVLKAQKW